MSLECESYEPLYYKEKGLAIEPYDYDEDGFIYDETRAFVVMKFPYKFLADETEPESIEMIDQAFYRSSGHNSVSQFGDNITDEDARGTWIPTNGLVVKSGYKDATGVCVLNSGFILKQPFVSLSNANILARFHGDSQLALVSYMMGGGIWDVPSKVQELSDLLTEQGNTDLTKVCEPGYVRLRDELVPALPTEINKYIANAVSWNWHPLDVSFLIKSGMKQLDLNDPRLWIENKGRYFIPENIFMNPGVIKNYNRYEKMMGEEKSRKITYGQVINSYDRCGWNNRAPIELYPK